MSTDRVALNFVASTPEKLDGVACGTCGSRDRMYRIDILRLDDDGPRRIGERVFCVCETRPAR